MKELIKKILASKRVAIFAHISPDLDCMSSMTALSCALNKLGIECDRFVDCAKMPEKFVKFYNWNDSLDKLFNKENYDTFICTDVAGVKQLGKFAEVVTNFNNVLVIDHHLNNEIPGICKYVDNDRSSCSEIIFDLINGLNVEIDKEIASFIYAGIIGDTCCFRTDNTTESTYLTAAKCIKNGADKNKIIFLFEKQQSLQTIKLRQIGFENMVIKNKVAYNIFTLKQFKAAQVDDAADFVNDILNIDDNIFSFVIKQKEKNYYTVSLRCKDGYDVASIARKFGGGGHIQAAGMSFVSSPTKMAKSLYEECLKQIENKITK